MGARVPDLLLPPCTEMGVDHSAGDFRDAGHVRVTADDLDKHLHDGSVLDRRSIRIPSGKMLVEIPLEIHQLPPERRPFRLGRLHQIEILLEFVAGDEDFAREYLWHREGPLRLAAAGAPGFRGLAPGRREGWERCSARVWGWQGGFEAVGCRLQAKAQAYSLKP